MIEVVVSLSAATICFLGQCHPVLVGRETPSGVFPLQEVRITAPYYGEDPYSREPADALRFARDSKGGNFLVHRVWLGNPRQEREKRIASPIISYRTNITDGCVNLSRPVYNQLITAIRRQGGYLKVTP